MEVLCCCFSASNCRRFTWKYVPSRLRNLPLKQFRPRVLKACHHKWEIIDHSCFFPDTLSGSESRHHVSLTLYLLYMIWSDPISRRRRGKTAFGDVLLGEEQRSINTRALSLPSACTTSLNHNIVPQKPFTSPGLWLPSHAPLSFINCLYLLILGGISHCALRC